MSALFKRSGVPVSWNLTWNQMEKSIWRTQNLSRNGNLGEMTRFRITGKK